MLVNKKPALVRDVYFLQIEKIERGGEKCEADGWLGSRMGGLLGKLMDGILLSHLVSSECHPLPYTRIPFMLQFSLSILRVV